MITGTNVLDQRLLCSNDTDYNRFGRLAMLLPFGYVPVHSLEYEPLFLVLYYGWLKCIRSIQESIVSLLSNYLGRSLIYLGIFLCVAAILLILILLSLCSLKS